MEYSYREIPERKRIALVAHDHRKADMLDWAKENRKRLKSHDLSATGTTGELLEEALELPVAKFLSGPMGGDQQIGAAIAEGKLDVLFFFWDPFEQQPHDPDIKALLRIAAVWNVPVACNRASADLIIQAPQFTQVYQTLVPDYQKYQVDRVFE